MTDERDTPKLIQGAGGGSKKSSSSSRAPVIAPDSVKSKALLSMLDLLCEGQIKGIVGGDEGIFINGTSLGNADGTKNYEGFSWEFRDGSQFQSVIEGFPDVSTPFNVAHKLTTTTAYTITVNDNDADQVRVIMAFPALSVQDEKTGDVKGTTVSYRFSLSNNGGPFLPVNIAGTNSADVVINDKSRAKYQREHLINLPKPGTNYKIRIQRLTPDTTSSYLANDSYLDSYYEILTSRLSYPNSAIVGFNINAEQFQQIPDRSYLVDGMYLRIPSNYNPETRVYTGVWDGTFKIGYSNNPAWVLLDLLLNTRYGLGNFVAESNINKAKLYSIARYCDGLVSDGFGNFEPRFTFNTSIAAQQDAYKVISDICSVFRGMSYWANGQVQVTQDSPTDPIYLFNNANVVDGMFNRMGSARKDRHSVVHVKWNDPEDQYKQKIEYVEDADLIKSIGYRRQDTIAFGCTSRAQAHRVGLWILYTEKVETNIINFTVGLEGLKCMPGDIIKIHDQYKAGRRNGGRLKGATRNGCKLDTPTQIRPGSRISISMPNGSFEEVSISQQTGVLQDITFASQLSTTPLPNAVWIMIELDLVPQLARCVGVAQGEKPGQFVISAVEHNPSKFASIEQGLKLETYPTTVLDPTFSTPENMQIEEQTYLVAPGQLGTKLEVSWEGKSQKYWVSWRATRLEYTTGWVSVQTDKASFEVMDVVGGLTYDFKVVGVAVTGKFTNELVGTYLALGTLMPPPPPTGLTAVGDFRQIILNWVNPDIVDFDYIEIFENVVDDRDTAYYLDRTPGNTYTRTGIPGLMKYWYWIRTVNKRGMKSVFNSSAGVSAIAGVIGWTDLDESLSTVIEEIGDGLDDIVEQVDKVTTTLNDRVDQTEALAAAARAGNSIEEMLRDDEDVQIKRDVYELGISVGEDIDAKIKTVTEVATSDREAIAHQLTLIETRFEENEAAFVQEQLVRSSADEASALQISGLIVTTENTSASLLAEQNVRATADSAQVEEINSLKAKTDTTNAGLASELVTRADADSALSQSLTALTAVVDDDRAAVTEEITARVDADGALASRIDAMLVTVGQNTAGISSEQTVRANADEVLAQRLDQMVVKTDNTLAALATEATSRADADGAITTLVQTAQATANGATALAQQNTSVVADTNGKLSAFWNMKLQLTSGGKLYSAGMGIGIENTSQGITQSQIAFQADRFVVLNPNIGTDHYPFQIIGGIVFISNAMIQNASIDNAKITDAAITNAKIADAAITTAKIGVAEIDTLRIRGNAVTVPTVATTTSIIVGLGVNVWHDAASITFTMDQPGFLFAQFGAYQGFGDGIRRYMFEMFVNGTSVQTGGGDWADGFPTLFGSTSVGAGTYTVLVRWWGEDAGVQLYGRTLFAMGCKR